MMANSSAPVCCAFESPILDQVLPPVLLLEFMFGLMGNSLVLWTFMFHMDTWKNNSVYLTHLAVADSVLLFCLPFRADYYMRGKNWIHGDVMCRLLLFLLACNRLAGIFFITAAAVDRYLRIVHPRNRINRMGLRYAQVVACGLWLLILTTTTYLLADKHFFFRNNRTQCESFNICMGFHPLSTWHNILYLGQFFMPGAVITFSAVCISWQLRSKIDNRARVKRAVQFVLVMALVFLVCFFPSNVTRIAVIVLKYQYNDCSYFQEVNLAFYTSVCFTYFNSMLNPVICYFSCPAFSRTFQELFYGLFGRKQSQEESAPNSNQTTNNNQEQQPQQQQQQQQQQPQQQRQCMSGIHCIS
ncbi:hydroxycarboxylic acid receptor 2-like [Anguilla anguilla]|uniref:hydroxycarboxylic acid receptor 2-like n=1 Tax=Anguilla anguilla TaxID=7936 RepID=UPI0015B23DF3|nr:hydroxycarboxylic acid receptor 2-like [Anguilla anguilla]